MGLLAPHCAAALLSQSRSTDQPANTDIKYMRTITCGRSFHIKQAIRKHELPFSEQARRRTMAAVPRCRRQATTVEDERWLHKSYEGLDLGRAGLYCGMKRGVLEPANRDTSCVTRSTGTVMASARGVALRIMEGWSDDIMSSLAKRAGLDGCPASAYLRID